LIDRLNEEPVRAICGAFGDKPDALLEILHQVQERQGCLGDTALRTIADALNISRAEIHGVVSFYHDYRRAPPARNIVKICRAEACQAVGCEDLAVHAEAKLNTRFGAKSADNEFGLEAVYCLGNCALGPAVMIDGDLYGRVTPQRFDALADARLDSQEPQ